jgi:hypothetical protein
MVDERGKFRWLVTCSCGWGRECVSQWAAESLTKLHPRLSGPSTQHTITIEEPPNQPAPEQAPGTAKSRTTSTGSGSLGAEEEEQRPRV